MCVLIFVFYGCVMCDYVCVMCVYVFFCSEGVKLIKIDAFGGAQVRDLGYFAY